MSGGPYDRDRGERPELMREGELRLENESNCALDYAAHSTPGDLAGV